MGWQFYLVLLLLGGTKVEENQAFLSLLLFGLFYFLTEVGYVFTNASCLQPTIRVTGVKRFHCQVFLCKESAWLLELHQQSLLQATQLGIPPGGHSLWAAADRLNPADGCFSLAIKHTLIDVGSLSLSLWRYIYSREQGFPLHGTAASMQLSLLHHISVFLSKITADRKQLLMPYSW